MDAAPTLPTLSLSEAVKDEATGVIYLRPGFYLGKHFDLVWKHGAPLCPVYLTFEGEGRNVEGNLPMADAMLECGLEAGELEWGRLLLRSFSFPQ